MGSKPLAAGRGTRRGSLPFRAVNRRGEPTHDAALRRHHLLPRQLVRMDAFARMFECLGTRAIRFKNFRRNGLLLPAREKAVLRLDLPLHRGPHRDYNAVVIERVGQIEMAWSLAMRRDDERAGLQPCNVSLRSSRTCARNFSHRASTTCGFTPTIRWARASTSPCSTTWPSGSGPRPSWPRSDRQTSRRGRPSPRDTRAPSARPCPRPFRPP